MTISTIAEDERVRRYVAAGGETAFPVPFPFFSAADLAVLRVRGLDVTTLTRPADYSVAGAGEQAGGSITLTAAAQAGDVIVIVSAQPVERTSAWVDGAALTARALNAELGRWWIALQQLRAVQRRTLSLPVVDPPATWELPPAALRANKVLGFDTTGQPIVTTPTSVGGVSPSAFGALLIQTAGPTAARALLGAAAEADVLPADTLVLRDGTQAMTGALRVAAGTFGGVRRPDEPETRIVTMGLGQWRIDCQSTTVLSCNPTGVTIHPALQLTGPATSDAQAVQLGQVRLQGLSWVNLSGSAVDFVGIPSAAREVVVMLAAADLSSTTEHLLIQIGGGSTPQTSGYSAAGHAVGATGAGAATNAGLLLYRQSNIRVHTGEVRWIRVPDTGMWLGAHTGFAAETGATGGAICQVGGAAVAPGTVGSVNVVRLRGSGASAVFSAGQAAVAWRL